MHSTCKHITQMHVRTAHACMHAKTYSGTHTHTHPHTHTHTHTHNTHIHTHIQTHTHSTHTISSCSIAILEDSFAFSNFIDMISAGVSNNLFMTTYCNHNNMNDSHVTLNYFILVLMNLKVTEYIIMCKYTHIH